MVLFVVKYLYSCEEMGGGGGVLPYTVKMTGLLVIMNLTP